MKSTNKSPVVEAMPKMKPMMTMTDEELPGIKDMKVGGKHRMMVDVEVMGVNKDEWSSSKTMSARLKINKAELVNEDNEATKQAKKGHY